MVHVDEEELVRELLLLRVDEVLVVDEVVSHGVLTGELCDEVRDVLVLVGVGVSLSQPVTGTRSQHSRIRRTRGAMMFTPNGCLR